MSDNYTHLVKFFVSTKADILTNKVNAWIVEMKKQYGYDISIGEVTPFMSYTTIKDKGAYMIGCMVDYVLFNQDPVLNTEDE